MTETEVDLAIAACEDVQCIEGEGCGPHRAAANAARLEGVEPIPADTDEDIAARVAAEIANPVADW